MVELSERFWSKTTEREAPYPHLTTPCRIWTASIASHGRPQFRYGARPELAYRLACAAKEGLELSELRGKVVAHQCDRPLCCEHVISGTQAENVADMVTKGRNRNGATGTLTPGMRAV